jgi:hypothetical protein
MARSGRRTQSCDRADASTRLAHARKFLEVADITASEHEIPSRQALPPRWLYSQALRLPMRPAVPHSAGEPAVKITMKQRDCWDKCSPVAQKQRALSDAYSI